MNKLFYKWEMMEVIPEYTRSEDTQIELYNYIKNSQDDIKHKIRVTIKNVKWDVNTILLNDDEIEIKRVHNYTWINNKRN